MKISSQSPKARIIFLKKLFLDSVCVSRVYFHKDCFDYLNDKLINKLSLGDDSMVRS